MDGMVQIRFKVGHRQYKVGDCGWFPPGMAQTFVDYHKAEFVERPRRKAVRKPPADKSMKTRKAVKRKAVTA